MICQILLRTFTYFIPFNSESLYIDKATSYILLKSSKEATCLQSLITYINVQQFLRVFSLSDFVSKFLEAIYCSSPYFSSSPPFGDSPTILQRTYMTNLWSRTLLGRKSWGCCIYTKLWVLWQMKILAREGKGGILSLSNFPIPSRNLRSLRGGVMALSSTALW